MRVLVTGATGFIGRHVVHALLDAGHDVRAFARGEHAGALPSEAEHVRGDVASRTDVERAAEGCDACVHLVAIIVERGSRTFDAVNRRGTEVVVRALEAAGVPRLVHVSAIGADPASRFPYLRSKGQADEVVRSSSLDWTVLRPSVVYGEGAGFFRPIVWTLRWMPVYPLPAGGTTRFQPVAVQDVARCVVASLNGTASKRTVDLGGPDVLSFTDIVRVVMRALAKRRRLVRVPLWSARPFAAIQGVRRDPLVTNEQLDMVVLDNVATGEGIEDVFGFTPVRMEETDLRWLARL